MTMIRSPHMPPLSSFLPFQERGTPSLPAGKPVSQATVTQPEARDTILMIVRGSLGSYSSSNECKCVCLCVCRQSDRQLSVIFLSHITSLAMLRTSPFDLQVWRTVQQALLQKPLPVFYEAAWSTCPQVLQTDTLCLQIHKIHSLWKAI